MASRLTEQRPPTPTPATVTAVDQAIPSFAELGVPKVLCDTLDGQGITAPFPIQVATLPDSLAGNDVLGRGRTGSGKTLAFSLPLIAQLMKRKIERTSRRPRALVLAPTRELALQISDTLKPLAAAAGLRTMVIIGGVNQNPQVNSLRQGVEIVVACPGRLEDLINQRHLSLEQVEVTVLDEADHMADLGFLPAVKRILDATPRDCQRMLFSATLDNGIDVIVKRYLTDPVTHSVDSEQSPVATMEHHVLHVTNDDRLPVLVDLTSAPGRTMVFTRTKQRAKQLTRALNAKGVSTVEMHGNLSQGARVKNLAAFSDGRATALVATDIAARGIHVDDVTLVIHADPPTEHKAYLHRSGRTARAGNDGIVVTLATEGQRRDVATLTKKAGIRPTVTQLAPGHPLLVEIAPGDRVTKSPTEIAEALAVAEKAQTNRPPRSPGSSNGRRGRGGQGGGGGGGQGGRSGGQSRSGGRSQGGAPASGGRRRSGAARAR
jgi:superfamily II DNA/RNA helicase